MEEELPKSYNPDSVEDKWYDFWERKGFFHADPLSKKEPYCIVMPPPNVTGVLHMGHALVNTLQDVMIRWQRMHGREVFWVPGLDHAGISTQTVVEKDLIAKTGKRRCDFEREVFLKHIWTWKERSEKRIVNQLKKLGCSCDWMRQRFTMDKEASLAVRTLFKKMFDEGLIYRGDYLVNWDPVTETALADDEVEYEERETKLWHFRYPLEGEEGHVTVATTRPETMLGDVAVAVSPEDPRYKAMIGKNVILPIVGRKLPIIGDSYVDPEFGTGVVKITPAHDPNDWELGKRHDLPLINLLHPNGILNENGLEYEGLSMEEARRHIVKRMEELGHLEKILPYTHRVGVSYRSKAIIEPYLSKQWFINMKPFKKKLIDAVKAGKVKLIPKAWENTYFHWIENLRDWCISRQLWWGHRIPIWYHESGKTLCFAGEGRPPEVAKDPTGWTQDPDVLDTWFSSSLWPFSALGWPHQTNELKKFYPNSALITGHDILFFWVARMLMMGGYVTGALPFAEVSLQGLIFGKSYWKEDEKGGITYLPGDEPGAHSKWEKMSKSKGNVIDPIEIIDTYGADAMRMALAASATHSPQIDLDRRRFEEFKNFSNKMWNGSRFVLMHLSLSTEELEKGLEPCALEDEWILSTLNRTIEEMNTHLNNYHFDKAAMCAYSFFWDEFCAYYVEMAKPALFGKSEDSLNPSTRQFLESKGRARQNQIFLNDESHSQDAMSEEERKLDEAAAAHRLQKLSCTESLNKQRILVIVLLAAIRLMHPIAPFITEEIFQKLKERFPHLKKQKTDPYTREAIKALSSPACITAPYPHPEKTNPTAEKHFSFMKEVIHAIRNIRAEMQLPPSTATAIIFEGATDAIEPHSAIISSLIRTQSLSFNPTEKPSGLTSSALVQGLKITIPLPKELQEKERMRLQKESEKLTSQIASLEKQLANPHFTEKAPPELVAKTRSTLADAEGKLKAAQAKLSNL